VGAGCSVGPVVAVVSTTGVAPQSITVPAGQMRHDGPAINVPLLFANPNIWQIVNNFTISAPAATVGGVPQTGNLKAGGRTGPPVVTWCPGYTATLTATGSNPACINPGGRASYLPTIPTCGIVGPQTPNGFFPCSGPATPTFIPGKMRYAALKNQFGGPGRGHVGGSFVLALRPGAGTVVAYGGPAAPQPVAALGAPFGVYNQGVPPPGKGAYSGVNATPLGVIISVGNKIGPGLQNITTGSFGGPLTTGTVTVSQPLATPPEVFVLKGTDARTPAGSGTISLVGGSVSTRSITGPNANRTGVTYVVPEAAAMLSAGAALVSLMVCHRLVRRRSR
jgi:hypothetical protein